NSDNQKEWEEYHKFKDDPRVTPIGLFLRKSSIDEFPQFINVLKGDMLIIGPRPLVEGELEQHNGDRKYWRVRPGITGWWACNGRSNMKYDERLEYEYYYVDNISFSLDVKVFLKTIECILKKIGSY
ncbi:MAG: sugar transferase, partial [Erysipelotrichaceae bacterium]|nr:sugar transferase [Erysipelotrichaceae bacterium]